MAHRDGARAGDGPRGQGRGAGDFPDAAPAAPQPRRAPPPPAPVRDYFKGPNPNHRVLPKVKVPMAACENVRYRVTKFELTGNGHTDQMIRDLIDSFNEIQEDRREYLELKFAGADKRELDGKFSRIQTLVANVTKLKTAIENDGAHARDIPSHFKKVPM